MKISWLTQPELLQIVKDTVKDYDLRNLPRANAFDYLASRSVTLFGSKITCRGVGNAFYRHCNSRTKTSTVKKTSTKRSMSNRNDLTLQIELAKLEVIKLLLQPMTI